MLSTTHLYPQAEEHAGCCLQLSNSQPIFPRALKDKAQGWAIPGIMLGCLSCLFIFLYLKFPSSQFIFPWLWNSMAFSSRPHFLLHAGLSHTTRKRKSVMYRVELPRSWLIIGRATCKPGVCVVVITPGAAGRARRRQSQMKLKERSQARAESRSRTVA